MKSILFCGLALLSLTSTHGQEVPPTSIPLEKTKTSLLSNDTSSLSLDKPFTNFRLFLHYSAKDNFKLKLGNHAIDLPSGAKQSADLNFEHLPDSPAVVHLTTSSDPTAQRIEFPDSIVRSSNRGIVHSAALPMDTAFTLMARFSTTSPNGTLAALAPAEGKWERGGKTLFLRGGQLTYDVGWEGALRGGPKVNDGKEHIAVVTGTDKGEISLYLDGKPLQKNKALTSRDKKGHVFKIGSTAPDFGGDFKDGSIEQVLFWKRALPNEDIRLMSKKRSNQLNTPDFHWKKPSATPSGDKPELLANISNPGYPTTVMVEKTPGLTIHEAWIQPLEVSDHRDIVSRWGKDSFNRGQKIYQQLCITCHGTAEQEGSIPIALKFHEGKFKNGKDPYRMWQTISKGYNMMMPMPQFSTRQKYDVIHYIREEFLAKHNKAELTKIDDAYLSSLPRGISGIEEKESQETPPPYEMMDFGNHLFWTYQIEQGPLDENVNIAQKGLAIRLDSGPGGVSKGKAWAIYDHDTMRLAAIYTGDQFVDWKGIAFDGSHGTHTSIVGERILVNDDKPGWAHPETGSWEPVRVKGKDGRLFGPLPKDWVSFKGLEKGAELYTLKYLVGSTAVKETIAGNAEDFTRTFVLEPHSDPIKVRLLPAKFGLPGKDDGFVIEDGSVCFIIPPSKTLQTQAIHFNATNGRIGRGFAQLSHPNPNQIPKSPPVVVTTEIQRGDESGPFAVDVLTAPVANLNPHASWMRTSGFDFYPDGKRAAVCTWMGDVWIVEGIDQLEGKLTWKRICSGLFQPLGLKIVNDKIHVTCRDQLARLHDTNGDETIDFIECLNNDHQVTEHFHEFAMGLQTDDKGNFYYAKSARHAKDSLVPHHGTLLRVSANGSKTDILATGFRAANGVCLNPDGTFIVTDQEGHWNPKNRINWVNGDGPSEFFGNVYGYSPVTDTSDAAMKNPLCWITNSFDRSPSELLWVPKDAKWGALNGQLLNLSYGYGKIFVVPHETIGKQRQGGLCELPLKQFPTGIMRGRFHPGDGQLYGCGMFAWAGTQQQAGGFYRVRKTNHAANLPTKIEASKSQVTLTLSDKIDPKSVNPDAFKVKAWDLKRTKNYGSKHYNEREWKVSKATLKGDKLTLTLPDLQPTWGMSIEMRLTDSNGDNFKRLIHNSIFEI
ncbi:c-type cytochrome, partial [Akkermansiaceae bacterium]|nr:c-type cytochrome [Akkermansiaceae bacterium]